MNLLSIENQIGHIDNMVKKLVTYGYGKDFTVFPYRNLRNEKTNKRVNHKTPYISYLYTVNEDLKNQFLDNKFYINGYVFSRRFFDIDIEIRAYMKKDDDLNQINFRLGHTIGNTPKIDYVVKHINGDQLIFSTSFQKESIDDNRSWEYEIGENELYEISTKYTARIPFIIYEEEVDYKDWTIKFVLSDSLGKVIETISSSPYDPGYSLNIANE